MLCSGRSEPNTIVKFNLSSTTARRINRTQWQGVRSTKLSSTPSWHSIDLYFELKAVPNLIKILTVYLLAMQTIRICGRDSSDTLDISDTLESAKLLGQRFNFLKMADEELNMERISMSLWACYKSASRRNCKSKHNKQ